MGDDASNLPADKWLVWDVPGKPVVVRLKTDAAGRLGMAVREGFKALPRRGLETGGLLIGTRADVGGRAVVSIDDFEPIESEHAAGPSYLLSDADRRLLEGRIAAREAAGGRTSVVGFYRSHTRRDFAITMEDAFLYSTYFRKASDVFLLIKRNDQGPPAAGFIIREDGKVLSESPYAQFPIETTWMAPAVRANSVRVSEASPSPPAKSETNPAPAAWRAIRAGRRPIWVAATAAVVLAALLSYGILRRIPGSRAAGPDRALTLNVTNSGSGLRLTWNHQAAGEAGHAVLWITDGPEERRFELDARQLGEGAVAYWPKNGDVTFRLELVSSSGTVSESVRAIGGPSKELVVVPAPTTVPAPGPAPAVQAVDRPARKITPIPESSAPQPPRNPIGTASRRLSRAFEPPPAEPRPATAVVASLPDPPALRPMVAPPPLHTGELVELPRPAGTVTPKNDVDSSLRVRVEAVPESRLSHLTRNIPLIGKRHNRSDYVPPAPVREPPLSNSNQRSITRDVDIDVKVYVNREGKVDFSEVLSNVGESNRDLAAVAMFSARRWEFVPARTADGTVPGEVILHYQFGPRPRTAGDQAVSGR